MTKLNVDGDRPEDPPGPSRPAPAAVVDAAAPCNHEKTGRNLVICIDGTGNQFGKKNTNVIEIYDLIVKANDKNQKTWYNSGIGTYARPSWRSLKYAKQVVYHNIDLAIAWEFERTVLDAYEWLSDNFEEGDCIFMFGFSRGAYQVRAISGMIDKAGLIYPGNKRQIPFAYELYADRKSDEEFVEEVGDSNQRTSMAKRFKQTFSRNVKVHFVGAWDTVSSIGLVRGKQILPGTVDGMEHVCVFRHALALDERRVKFLPEYAYGGAATKPKVDPVATSDGSDKVASASEVPVEDHTKVAPKNTEKRPQTMEVWFAGTHSDIGGGNVENKGMDRSRPPLRWMVFEARAAGLRTAPFKRELTPDEQIEIKESLTGLLWYILEWFFFMRLTYMWQGTGDETTYWPHRGAKRHIHEGQKIHSSLVLASRREKDPYVPEALLPPNHNADGLFWEKLLNTGGEGIGKLDDGLKQWLEVDLYVSAEELVQKFAKNDNFSLDFIHPFLTTSDGVQAVYDKLCEDVLEFSKTPAGESLGLDSTHWLLSWGMKFFEKYSQPEKLGSFVDLQGHLAALLNDARYRKVAESFLLDLTSGNRTSLAVRDFLQDGALILHVIHPLLTTDDGVQSVYDGLCEALADFSRMPATAVPRPDAKHRMLSRGVQLFKRYYPPENLRPFVDIKPLVSDLLAYEGFKTAVKAFLLDYTDTSLIFRGHKKAVSSVSFSADGKRVVSGSYDKNVHIWDASTGQMVAGPFYGHKSDVNSVAFSPDGQRVVSGSDDKRVRIWDVATGETVVGPLKGHKNYVCAVAFSPDGKRIVSGSADETMRTWYAVTGMAARPFTGHTGWVMSVAFSPDGKYVVSGGNDESVRIWDEATGETVVGPVEGHVGGINSVAFSPDGKRVASGSDDQTVRIWDAATGEMVAGPFEGHSSGVWSVAFSPDGQHVVSGSLDKTVRIWHAATGVMVVGPFEGHRGGVISVAFSPDGKRVVSASADTTVRIWDAATGKICHATLSES